MKTTFVRRRGVSVLRGTQYNGRNENPTRSEKPGAQQLLPDIRSVGDRYKRVYNRLKAASKALAALDV